MAFRRRYRRKTRRTRRGRYARRKTARIFQRRVKRVIMKTTEQKYLVGAAENVQLYHDVGAATGPTTNQVALLFNPWVNISKGDTVSQRTGDEVYARGMKVRLWLANKLDRPNIIYRIMVVIMPKYYNGFLVSATNTDIFQVPSGNNTLCSIVKREGFKVLYDRCVPIEMGFSYNNTANAGKECHKFKKFYIKSKKGSKLKWMEDGSLANRPMAFYVIPYDSYGTLQTDNIASCAYSYCCYFRDP